MMWGGGGRGCCLDGQLRALRVYCFVYVPFVAAGMRCRREAAWGPRRRRGAIAAATPTVPLPRAGEPVALGVDMVSLPSCLAVADVNTSLPWPLGQCYCSYTNRVRVRNTRLCN